MIRRLLISSYISMIAIAVMVNLPPTCLTSIKGDFSLSDTQGGMLLSTLFWGFALTIILTGPLADRFGVKPFLISASILQIFGLLMSTLSSIFQVLVFGAFLMGMGSGILEVLVNPLICILTPENRTRAINFCHAFYSIGAVLTVLMASLFLRMGLLWRYVYLLGIFPSLLFGVGYLTSSIPELPSSDYKRFFGIGLMVHPIFILLLLAMLLGGGTELGAAQWIPAYLEEVLGLSRFGGAFGLVLFSTAMALGRMTMSKIGGRAHPMGILRFASLSCVLLLALSALFRSGTSVVISFSLLGFFVSIFWPTVLACSSEIFLGGGATMFSLLSAAGNAGGMIFPAMVGAIADRWNLRVGIGTLSLLPLLLTLIFTLLGHRRSMDEKL
ncbi:MFS transporter [Candidatus Poribacteria bacterium]|nr:MFS transporter [Candidatus Poribacteria bacterium]